MNIIKEKPIIFNTEMIQAILDDRKSITRRVIKPQPDYSILKDGVNLQAHKCPILGPVHLGRKEWGLYGLSYKATAVPCFAYNCPYGKIGDRLWVRETWDTPLNEDDPASGMEVVYKATPKYDFNGPWRPSIFMPRWASRITLEITDIRIEKVQNISKEDCEAEGIWGETKSSPINGLPYEIYHCQGLIYSQPIEAFKDLWNSINAKPKPVKQNGIITHHVSYPWHDVQEIKEYRGKKWYVYGNPFVWVITFKMIKQEV